MERSDHISKISEFKLKQCELKYGVIYNMNFNYNKICNITDSFTLLDDINDHFELITGKKVPPYFTLLCQETLIERTLKICNKCELGIDSTISIPNGCCDDENCPIRLYHIATLKVIDLRSKEIHKLHFIKTYLIDLSKVYPMNINYEKRNIGDRIVVDIPRFIAPISIIVRDIGSDFAELGIYYNNRFLSRKFFGLPTTNNRYEDNPLRIINIKELDTIIGVLSKIMDTTIVAKKLEKKLEKVRDKVISIQLEERYKFEVGEIETDGLYFLVSAPKYNFTFKLFGSEHGKDNHICVRCRFNPKGPKHFNNWTRQDFQLPNKDDPGDYHKDDHDIDIFNYKELEHVLRIADQGYGSTLD